MPHISEMHQSKFMTKGDVRTPILVTIRGVEQQNMALQGAPVEMKWVLHFQEQQYKPLVLNQTKIKVIAHLTGGEHTDNWMGRKLVLYEDPTIMNRGQVVGGIAIRAPRTAKPATPAPPATPVRIAPEPPSLTAAEAEPEPDPVAPDGGGEVGDDVPF